MKISVIIPVYNASKYLGKCLSSVAEQSYRNWEVIAIDDGSTDGSFDILKDFAKYDERFHVFHKENEGPGLTRNKGIQLAEGDFIVFLDSDDYIEPNYFELLESVVSREQSDVVFIDLIQETPEGELIRHEKMSRFRNKTRHELIGCQMTGFMPWGGVRKAASAKLIKENNLRYSEDTVGEEAIFSFELLRLAKHISFIDESLYHYVNHPGSQSKSKDNSWDITLNKMSNHIMELKNANVYYKCINSFALMILISRIIRTSNTNSFFQACKLSKKHVIWFKENYSWHVRLGFLRYEARILYFLIRYQFVGVVVLLAKIYR